MILLELKSGSRRSKYVELGYAIVLYASDRRSKKL